MSKQNRIWRPINWRSRSYRISISISGGVELSGKRYWIPVGGGLIPGSISVFDEGTLVGTSNSITQLNFEGAAVEAFVDVQNPTGHPGMAATVTVIPVTIGNNPPSNARNGELWWESDKGDLYIYYQDNDSAQWVMANAGGQGPVGVKGQKGQKGEVESEGNKGQKGEEGQKGNKGDFQKGQKGEIGDKGSLGEKGVQGDKGNEGDKGIKGEGIKGNQGDKAGLRYRFSSVTVQADPTQGVFRYDNGTVSNVSEIYIDDLDVNSVDVSNHINLG